MLFGMDGVEVTEAEREADGRLTSRARITLPAMRPGCRTVSEKVHQYVTVTPRDVRACGQDTDFFLVKRRMECAEKECPAETFTESVPQLPLRCTITRRLAEHAGAEVADRGITPAEAGRDAGIRGRPARDVRGEGGPDPGRGTALVAHLGIDEHRRGPRRGGRTPIPANTCRLADRWHVCFMTWDGNQGLLGQVEGRTADDTAYWLAGATPAGATPFGSSPSTGAIFASAVRKTLPRAAIAVDLFHVVQLAVKTVGDVRRRAIRELYGSPRQGRRPLSTASSACSRATWRACHQSNSRRSSRHSTPPRRRSSWPSPGSRRRNSAVP